MTINGGLASLDNPSNGTKGIETGIVYREYPQSLLWQLNKVATVETLRATAKGMRPLWIHGISELR